MNDIIKKFCTYQKEKNFEKQRVIIKTINSFIQETYPYDGIDLGIYYILNDLDIYHTLEDLIEQNQLEEGETESFFLNSYYHFSRSRIMPSSMVYYYFDGEGEFYSYEKIFDFFIDLITCEDWMEEISNDIVMSLNGLIE